jgi:hypothetical protein
MGPKLILKRWLSLWLATLLLTLTPAWAGLGQPAPTGRLTRSDKPALRVVQPPGAPALAPAKVEPAVQPILYIALARTAPKVSIQFAASEDSNGDPVNPGTTFAFGLKRLYFYVTIIGALGHAYREEWTINGRRETTLDYSSTIPYDAARYSNAIYYQDGRSLGRGSYVLNIFLDNTLYSQSTAVIQ